MVGVVAGVGLGLERSSANLLGANGLLGAPGFGEGPDDVYVNAVNGNLVILRTDQVLAGIGTNDVVSEAYNSQGTYTAALGASGGSWMGDYQRGVSGLTGTVNTAGSTVTRTAADGSQVVYTYQTTGQYAGMYIGYENSGATDTLTYSAGTNRWTWTDGDTQATETYDWANGGRIMFATDLDGNKLTYNYTGSQLTSIATTDSGGHQDTTSFNYTGSQLTSVSTSYWDIPSGTQKSLTQEYYSYDAQGRLSTVTIDLSPADGSIADGNKFTTTYGYQSTSSNLITSITGSDGSSLTIGYFTGTNKVQTVTQTAATGVTRTTTFGNTYGSGSELVTDPLGIESQLTYTTTGTAGLLTQVNGDLLDGSGADLNQIIKFGGWTNLNVGTITDPDNTVVTYGYNASGDRTSQTDAAGDVTNWTFGSLNQLLATTVTPATGVTDTSYDVYDASNNLRFTVTQQGVVTQYLYGASPGEVTSVISYTNDTFSTAGYSASSPPSLATMTSWAAGLADLQNTQRADTTYDIRGDVASVTSYGADTTTGAGATSTTENSVTNYVYDSAGQLLVDKPQAATTAYSYNGLQRLPTNAAGATTQYDGFGRVTSATDLDGATTRYAYSLTSSSSYAINAMGTVTLTTRDDAGEVTSTTVYAHQLTTAQLTALGAAPTFTAVAADVTVTAGSDETTSYKYDADGRLMMVTDPKGNKSYFLYDTLGRKTADIDALGDVTEYRYNADNQVAETIQYATPLTSTQLTTLAGASVTSPIAIATVRPAAAGADRYGWSVYDSAHRLIETIDGLGSVTAYAYDKASNLVSTTSYATQLTPTQLTTFKTTPPTTQVLPSPTSSDRTTRSFYDGDQRLIGTLDPDGYVTEIFYDSAGQKTRTVAFDTVATPSLWATGTWAQLLASVGTATATDGNTWYVYDARGDLRGKVDGDGDVTQYHYDPLGDVDETIAGQTLSVATLLTTPPTMATLSGLSTTGAAVTDLTFNFKGQALTSRNNVVTTPVTNTYDALGNLIETVDANGDKTFSYYDSFNRKIAEVSAVGTLTTWTYDQDNNVSSETTYGDAVTLPGSPGGTPPSPTVANDYRRTSYTYDADGRVTLTSVSAGGGAFAYGNDTIEIGSWNGSSYAVSTPSSLTSQTSYDAFGNVWKSVDANGAATYAFYNAVGQKIAAVDGDGYLTGYNLNTFWDVATQTQYATALSAGTISAFTAATDNVSPTPTTNANDRITSFTYDGDGNVLTQSRANVAYATISANSVSTSSATSTVTYTYNFLGEQLTEHQATGDTTTNVYTAAGRLSKVTNPSYTDAGGGTDTPQSVYSYNGLGLVTSIASGQSGSPSRTTSYTYDAIGRKTSLSDASSFVQYYAYDNDGNLTSVDYLRASSTSTTGAHQTTVNGHSVNEQIVYTYDAANEQLTQATSDWNGSAWVSGDPTSTTYDTANLQYDAYGEVVGKGINGLYQITQTYDGVGRLISSNANGGSTSFFDYDGDGHLTLQIASAGTNLTGDTLSAALTAAGPTIGVSYVPGLNLTISKYDAKGQATAVIQPNQQLNASTHTTFTSSVAYDAFGDAVTSTNALGAATNSFYNTLGQLIETQAPQITVDTVGSGNVVTQNVNLQPTTYDYYDLSGRLVATKDANGNLTTQSLLAGSGYGGSQALIVEQWQPDNGQMIYGYDVFGDQTKVTDQLGRVTTKTFDGMGRLLTQTLPTDSPNAALTDFYAYDGLGQRVAQTNSLLNALSLSGYNSGTLIASAGAKQTSDYDSQGRLVSTEDYLRTYQTTYDYAWSGSAPTTGLGTFGGWTKTDTETQLVQTTNQLGQATAAGTMRTETTTSDFFGHTLSVTPFTGCLYTYNYNAAAEVAGVGSNFAYTYYNSGQVATIAEGPSGSQMVTTYGYDGLAEKVSETQVLGSTSYENETAAYDAMGWVTSIHDTGNAAAEPITMTYAYDANGNVVNAHTVYETLGGNGTGSATQATVDDWFTYDTMNREVTSQGQLSGSTIMRLEQGTDTVYDAAGERVSASSTSQVYNGQTCTYNYDVHTEWYAYTPDGYLKTVTANDTTYTSEPGDVIASSTGAYTAASNSYDAMGRLTQQVEYNAGGSTVAYSRTNIVYNADSLVLSDTTQRDNNGTYANNNELYFYNAATGSGPYGVYEDGQLTNLGIYDTSGLYGSGNTKFTYVYTYSWTTEALQTQIAYTIWGSNGSTAYTNLTYGANNELTSAAVGGVGTISYVNNAEGEIVDRSSSAGPASEYYYLSGHQVGSVSNAGADQFNYASSISNQVGNVTPTGASADFDGTQTVLGSNSPAPTAGSYTIQAGDTLQSIAQNVYGDANLWYLLADTNGLSAGAALAPGQSISLPNQVVNIGNTSQTFKPYDSNQATGQIQPRPMPHNNHGGCGGIGAIIVAIVAIAINFIPGFQGWADGVASGILNSIDAIGSGLSDALEPILAGAIEGTVGNAVGQGVAIAVGAQNGFDWGGLAMAGIGAGVSAGVTEGLGAAGVDGALNDAVHGGTAGEFVTSFANGAVANVITQGIGVATGLQKSFDWTGVATSGVEGGTIGASGNSFIGSVGALLAGATTRTLLTGENFGQSLVAEAPNTVAAFIGNEVGGAIDDVLNQCAGAGPSASSAANAGTDAAVTLGGPTLTLPTSPTPPSLQTQLAASLELGAETNGGTANADYQDPHLDALAHLARGEPVPVGEPIPDLSFWMSSPSGQAPNPQPNQATTSALLNQIALGEGTGDATALAHGFASGYDITLGYGQYASNDIPLSQMTISQVEQLQTQMRDNGAPTSAVGRYEFVKGTLVNLASQLGLSDDSVFSSTVQDQLATQLLDNIGLNKFIAGTMSAATFQDHIATQWASVADFETGVSHYGQHTGTSTVQIQSVLSQLSRKR